MSVSKWAYEPEKCDGDFCIGECDLCNKMEGDMSWYSDKEKFNEHDDPYCIWKSKASGGKCGKSKEECDRCCARHEQEAGDGEEEDDDAEVHIDKI